MSTRLVGWASSALSRRVDDNDGDGPGRRSFLVRTAVVGSALAAAPADFVLRPKRAYAALCNCNGSTCDCSSLCCDGYTEFCCQIYGGNDCPPGTAVAGWWKADGSGFCDVDGSAKPRYYLDCNAFCEDGCGCGSSGICATECTWCASRSGCAHGRCSNRKTCRTRFRYGQCNNDIRCLGPIVCRVVTCTPPWTITKFDCNASPATDNNTRFHNRPCLQESDPGEPPPPPPPPAIEGQLVVGDWTGGGTSLPGVFADGVWYLRTSLDGGEPDTVFAFGRPGDVPVVGDWTGSGKDLPGVVRNGRQWFLATRPDGTGEVRTLLFGRPGDAPVAGKWTGGDRSLPGVLRDGRTWFLATDGAGIETVTFDFGRPGDRPVVGDWDGDGTWDVGVVRGGSQWFLRTAGDRDGDDRAAAPVDSFVYGRPDDEAVTGDWNGDGTFEPAVVRRQEFRWYLRMAGSGGPADRSFEFPPRPRAGDPRRTSGRTAAVTPGP